MPASDNWQSAHGYCSWLGKQTGLLFSLPTEAQWEYVARDRGQDIAYPTDNGKLEVGKNYPSEDTFNQNLKGTILPVNNVNEIPMNKLGIYEMGGNVLEWMKDWYAHNLH